MSLRCLIFLTIGVNLACEAGAQTNWPFFRGPNATGIAAGTTTLSTWNAEKSENILWGTPIPGLGHSSPIIWEDRLFVTTAVSQKGNAPLKVGLYGDPASADDNDVQQWRIFCLNKKTGEILWQTTAHEGAPKAPRHPKATHANCTMATDGTNVVAFFGSEGLYCYDLDGHLRWQKTWALCAPTRRCITTNQRRTWNRWNGASRVRQSFMADACSFNATC